MAKQYIRFDITAEKPKTKVWVVSSISSGDQLGTIAWSGPWRQYVFDPEDDTTWSWDCLRTVQEFLRSQTEKQKAGAHADSDARE